MWLVVRARGRSEFAAEADLSACGAYCPTMIVRRRPRRMHGRAITRAIPRFTGYLFCADNQSAAAGLIRRSRHALGLVRCGEVVARVADDVIAALKAADDIPPEDPAQIMRLAIGDQVVIAAGAFEGKAGEVVRVGGDSVGVNLVGSRFRTSVRSIDLVRAE